MLTLTGVNVAQRIFLILLALDYQVFPGQDRLRAAAGGGAVQKT